MKDIFKLFFRSLAFLGCIIFCNKTMAQKRPLTHLDANSWPLIVSSRISNDGQYIAYKMKSEMAGASLTIQDIAAKWKMEIPGSDNNYQFTEDSRWLIYSLPNDSIGLLELGKLNVKYITQVSSFEMPANGNGRWLVCLIKDDQHDLLVMDLQQGTKTMYPEVREFRFSPNGDVLLFQTNATKDAAGRFYWLDLTSRKKTCIGNGYRAFNMAFDKSGSKLAFLANDQNNIALRYYESRMDSAKLLVNSSTAGMNNMKVSSSLPITFSKMEDKIFFGISQDIVPTKEASKFSEKVHLKGYRDEYLKSASQRSYFLTVVNLRGTNKVLRLQQNNDRDIHLGGGANDDYVATESNFYGNREESYRRVNARPDIYLISTKDGSRRLIKRRLDCNNDIKFSPTGKYLVWYDRTLKQWFSHDVVGGGTRNITSNIKKTPLYNDGDSFRAAAPEGIAAWMGNDTAVLIYDHYDLWQVDPKRKLPPISITQEYGRKNNLRFRLLNFGQQKPPIVTHRDTLLLTALDLTTKSNGFFKLPLTTHGKLHRLIMEPKAFDIPFPQNTVLALSGQAIPMDPQRSKEADVYLLNSMSANEYSNLNITNDFIHFKPITNFAPQNAYNWYTSELVHWKLFDGRKAEGILYKPENFDTKKKYPVIFYYYEQSANALNLFLNPELCRGDINIPWFTSNGYLVFVPDIYYKTGHPGESAYNSVVSAAQMLRKKSWVDADKMGLQGHSFGGYETNYIVSHSHLFAAAASGAGSSDLVSEYSLDGQSFSENSQGRMGATLWQRPDLYIKNSPIFSANKVTTPVFIMHNKGDGNVAWTQGEEWYSDLVRLGKKAWMVSYDGARHTIEEPSSKLDYSIRLAQFFDYYLKGALPPKWMTENSSSLELDHSGKKP